MRRQTKSIGKILHYCGDSSTSPTRREDIIAKQIAQSIAQVEADDGDARLVRHTGTAGESPRAEARHEGTEPGDQPRDAATSAKVLGRGAVEANDIQSHTNHEQEVASNDGIVDGVRYKHPNTFV